MGKGSNTTTQNTSTTPDPNAYQAYLALLNRASGVASTPYQGFGGQEIAPVNAQQQAGISGINAAQPGFQTGFNQIQGSTQPLTAAQIQQYESPYTQQVVNATEAQFNNQNAQQQSQVLGNAAAQGALGGDRVGVAQALTAGQQQLAQAPVIAGLYNTGYNQAVQTAAGQQQLGLQGGQAEIGATTAGIAGAGAQVGAGTLEQQTQQAQDTQARQDYYQQQGYPFQVAQWLAALDTGVGSQMGGTGTGVTQGPTPNPWAQAAGVGLAGASLFAKEGGRITEKRAGFASGGIPYGDQAPTWVPTAQIHPGSGAPHVSAPSMQKPQGGLSADQMKGIGVVGKGIANSGFGDAMSDYLQDTAEGDAGSLSTYIGGSWRGGRVKRYAVGGFADGGDPNFDDRYDAAFPNYRTTAGIGASAPAFDDRFPHEDDRFDVATPEQERAFITSGRRGLGAINPEPGDEFRLDPSATRAGLDETDAINGPDIAAAKGDGNVMAGVSAIRSAAHLPDEDAGAPESATAYQAPDRGLGAPRAVPPSPEPAPEDQPEGGLLSRLGIHVTPEMRQGLLQAGLAMMSTTRGGPGSFLGAAGEAGMAGVGSYNKSLELAQKQREKAREQEIEDEKLKMLEETHQQTMGASPLIRGPNGQMIINPIAMELKRREADIAQKDNWVLAPSDGIHPDRLYNKVSGEFKDVPEPTGGSTGAAASGLQPGQFDYRSGSPRLQKGDEVPDPPTIAGHAPDALKRDAEYYLTTGTLPRASVSARSNAGVQQMIYQRAVQNYAVALANSKGMNMAQMADLQRFGTKAASFPLSRQGDQTVAIGTAIRHIGALEEYAKAWDASKGNVNAPILRQAAARFATFLGKEEPTNLEQAARIAGPEIIKAIGVAGAGTGGERYEQEKGFQPGASTAQILGSANVARTFLAGQLPAKEAQASNVGFPHERFMSMVGPTEYDYLTAINHGKPVESGKSGTTAAPPTISSKAEYDKLPSGTKFTKDGKTWTKP